MPNEIDIDKSASLFGREALENIGLIVCIASMSEHSLHMQCQRLANHPNPIALAAAVGLHGTAARTMLRQIRSLGMFHLRKPTHMTELGQIVDRIEKAFLARNEIVHGSIQGTGTGIKIIRLRLKKGRVVPRLEQDNASLRDLAKGILASTRALDVFLTNNGIAPLKDIR